MKIIARSHRLTICAVSAIHDPLLFAASFVAILTVVSVVLVVEVEPNCSSKTWITRVHLVDRIVILATDLHKCN